MSLHLYRISVAWPTPDGRPWPRVVGNPHSSSTPYGCPLLGEDDEVAWLVPLREDDTLCEFELQRDLGDEVTGWLLPHTKRRQYLSRSAALEWKRRAELLGAVVTVTTSEPIRFPEDAR